MQPRLHFPLWPRPPAREAQRPKAVFLPEAEAKLKGAPGVPGILARVAGSSLLPARAFPFRGGSGEGEEEAGPETGGVFQDKPGPQGLGHRPHHP